MEGRRRGRKESSVLSPPAPAASRPKDRPPWSEPDVVAHLDFAFQKMRFEANDTEDTCGDVSTSEATLR